MYTYSERIVRAMAEHYKHEDAVIAWQIDNELGHEDSDICYCAQCRTGFQKYLREKFRGDIHALNETYGTVFWSQEYNDFDEIPLPGPTITTHNPALRLDWERFRSESIVRFADFQCRLIREIIPVSYTHLDVYKRQPEYRAYADKTPILLPFVPLYHLTDVKFIVV